MKHLINYPNASMLIESMRSIGYTFETALCDIIDNSIYAKAKNINIECNVNENDFLGILDDGTGMDKFELFEAMRYGSKNPIDERSKDDLGRFGLGLKSASLSQCRKLIVISKRNDKIEGLSWDLDYIRETNDWNLLEYNFEEIRMLPMISKLNELESGTLVIWKNLDRIEESANNIEQTLSRLIKSSEERISLVFHRIIRDDEINIILNGNPIVPLDPFLENNTLTQMKREEAIEIDGEIIKVKPYILPHANKLGMQDFIKIGGKESLKNDQGFYIYRNRRLIIWGTWFRLNSYNELTRLARIKVDIPNTLDYIWNIDIKKSQASIPDKVKKALISFVLDATGISQEVHEYRGRRINSKDIVHVWNVIKKDDVINLEINYENPQMCKLLETLDKKQMLMFNDLIMDIEKCVPVDTIFTQIAKNNKITSYEDNEEDLMFRLNKIINDIDKNVFNYVETLRSLKSVEPFSNSITVKNKIDKIIEGYING